MEAYGSPKGEAGAGLGKIQTGRPDQSIGTGTGKDQLCRCFGKMDDPPDPLDMSWGETLKVSGEDFEEIFEDVLSVMCGLRPDSPIWNFPCFMKKIRRTEQIRESGIRFFDYPEVCYEGQLNLYEYNNDGIWLNPENLGYFSAGLLFCKKTERPLNSHRYYRM